MADKEELTEKIQCLECGKYFSFLLYKWVSATKQTVN